MKQFLLVTTASCDLFWTTGTEIEIRDGIGVKFEELAHDFFEAAVPGEHIVLPNKPQNIIIVRAK